MPALFPHHVLPRLSHGAYASFKSLEHTRKKLHLLILLVVVLGGCSDSREPARSIEVARGGVQASALATDGSLAVIGSMQHGGSLWRTKDGERLFNWNHAANEQTLVVAAAFSANGARALTADTGTLVLWDTASGAADRFWMAPGKILAVALDGEGERALLGLATELAVLFDVKRGGILRSLRHTAPVTSVALSKDGRLALTGADDSKARLWDMSSGELLTTIAHKDSVQLLVLSNDASLALSVSKYDKALLWQTQNGAVIGEIPLGAERLKRGLRFTAATFSPDSRSLLTGRADRLVELWDTQSLTRLDQWRLPKRDAWQPTGAAVLDVAFSANGADFVALTSNGFIHFLESEKAKPEATE